MSEILSVGKPYHPGRRLWPEVADYNFRAGVHELRIFRPHVSKREIEAAAKGPVEFGLLIEQPELFVISRFANLAGRHVMSFHSFYSWHLVPAAERVSPPPWEETSPELRALCTIILVEATTGIIHALRTVSFSAEFTRAIHKAIADQAALSYDQATHESGAWAMIVSSGQELSHYRRAS